MRVVAVVVHWRGLDDTRRCVASLRSARTPLPVVLVDNGSGDPGLAALAAADPGVTLLAAPENRGFSVGCNDGAWHAIDALGAQALFFLNNDARVEPTFLAPLVAELGRSPGAGAVAPAVLFEDDPTRVWCAGGRLRLRENVSELIGFGMPASGLPSSPRRCDYLPGCAMLVRTELFRGLRGFDPDYFAYMEDVDFGLRAGAQGAECWVVPESRAYHRPSSSTGGGYSRARKYANALNSVRFLRRHGSPARWLAFLVFDVLGLPVAWLREVLRGGDPSAVGAKARGLWSGIRGGRVTASTFAGAPASPRDP